MLLAVLAGIFVFGMIVLVHEFGHFMTAKWFGMQVDEFAIGFGPKLFSYKKGGTLYSLRMVPLGGFNKIVGMDLSEDVGERSFCKQKVYKRFIVIAAGALMNLFLAIVLFWGLFAIQGTTKFINEPVVGAVMQDTPAQRAQFMAGDRIVSINHKKVSTWTDITTHLEGTSNQVIDITLERQGQVVHMEVIPIRGPQDRGIIGINPVVELEKHSIGESLSMALSHTWRIMVGMWSALYSMITGHTQAEVSGPIGVAKMAGEIAEHGFTALLAFTALLSINLGIINLLPLPALDGGHLILLLLEAMLGKPLPQEYLYKIQLSGVVLMGLLFLYATYHDVLSFLH